MKKLITIIALLFAMFTLSATPKFTMLDYNAGNTPEYIAKFVELDTTKKIIPEHSKYMYHLRLGTWLIENEGQAAVISVYKGKPIYGTSVLLKHE